MNAPSTTVDEVIGVFDRALRTLTGVQKPERPAPRADEGSLSDVEKKHAAGLMRVNHTGEVCAQALYEGQSLTAREPRVRAVLKRAAAEEADHLVWCRDRLDELDSRPSVLDPVFYATSCALGAVTGLLGDRVSLGFVAATEDEVVKHLDRHLERLPPGDARSRAIVAQMREDEARHGTRAEEAGALTFPQPVKRAMTLLSKVMTETVYRG